MIEDGHNCLWLMKYPHETLVGGSMYGFQLPETIPAQGAPEGPPLPADRRNFGGAPGEQDFRLMFLNCLRDPGQLQPTMERIKAEFQAQAKKKK